MDKIGRSIVLMVHGTGHELFDEIPPDGEVETIGRVAGIWAKQCCRAGSNLIENPPPAKCCSQFTFAAARVVGVVTAVHRTVSQIAKDHQVTYGREDRR